MNCSKDIVEAGRRAWNEISSKLDAKPTLYETYDEFEVFYKQILITLMNEESNH